MFDETIFPLDHYCIVDQKPISNDTSLYCSERCRNADYHTESSQQPRKGQLVTYKTIREGDSMFEATKELDYDSDNDDESVFRFEEDCGSVPSLVTDISSEDEEEELESSIRYEWLYEAPASTKKEESWGYDLSLGNSSYGLRTQSVLSTLLDSTSSDATVSATATTTATRNYQLWLSSH